MHHNTSSFDLKRLDLNHYALTDSDKELLKELILSSPLLNTTLLSIEAIHEKIRMAASLLNDINNAHEKYSPNEENLNFEMN